MGSYIFRVFSKRCWLDGSTISRLRLTNIPVKLHVTTQAFTKRKKKRKDNWTVAKIHKSTDLH